MSAGAEQQTGRLSGIRGFAFVGRDEELAALVAALSARPAIVLLRGEAGIGKSRLVAEALAVLSRAGVGTLVGVCHPLREPLPFGPVIDALSRIGPVLRPGAHIGAAAGALAPWLPDLADRLPAPPDEPTGTEGRPHAACRGTQMLLSAAAPVVIVIEDLHWADDATRELLLLLAGSLPDDVGLVLTYRTEEQPGPLLGREFRRPAGVGLLELSLDRLSRTAVSRMARAALGGQAAGELTQALYERSVGLPLILEEDLITLSGRPAAAERPELLGVPRSLREVLATRIEGMAPQTQGLVAAAAVVAVPTGEQLLADAAGLTSDQGAVAIEEALERSVLVEHGPDAYGFSHALARRAAYDALPGPRRNRLHRRVLGLLSAQEPPPLVQLAHHSKALGDSDLWLRYARAAAEQALAVGDLGTAAAQLRQIIDHPGLPTGELGDAARSLAEAVAYTTDASDAVVAALRRIAATPGLAPAVRGEIRARIGNMLRIRVGGSAGVEDLEAAAVELEADNPAHAAKTFSVLASMDTGDATAAERKVWMDRALALLERVDDPETAAIVHVNQLVSVPACADPGVPGLVAALSRETGSPRLLQTTAVGLSNAAEIAYCVGLDARVRAWADEAIAIAEKAQMSGLMPYSRSYALPLTWAAGRWTEWDEALAEYRARSPDSPVTDIGLLGAAQGVTAAARGHSARAKALFEGALAQDATSVLTMPSSAGLARLHLARSEPDAAWQVLAPAVRMLRRREAWPFAFDLLPTAVETALLRSDRPTAVSLAEEQFAGITGLECPGAVAEHHLADGLLCAVDSPAEAAACFERAADLWLAIGRPYPAALATERAALARLADPTVEAGLLARATDAFDRIGAATDSSRCRRLLRTLNAGRPPQHGSRDTRSALSPREQQVAALLADGASNRDIAEALYLSERTVEHHVAAVLRKLGTTRNVLKRS
ncbi:ATP-binding protein [Streptacidiphilus anmyonensis]|uniref:ATP-binding protein n=1 Tax=Streptacidiphilus anmyonensis TaxID=405782 RepID=UPI0005AB42C3|nr:LuxR family transcriptional regulator [Streptacidiphilus anmyonensis]